MSLTAFLTEEASTEEARSRCLKIDVSVILDSGYTSQISLWYKNILPYLIRIIQTSDITNLVLKVPSIFLTKNLKKENENGKNNSLLIFF